MKECWPKASDLQHDCMRLVLAYMWFTCRECLTTLCGFFQRRKQHDCMQHRQQPRIHRCMHMADNTIMCHAHVMQITGMQCVQHDIPEIRQDPVETLDASHMHLHPGHYTTITLQRYMFYRAFSYRIAALYQADLTIYCSLTCTNDSTCQRTKGFVLHTKYFVQLLRV